MIECEINFLLVGCECTFLLVLCARCESLKVGSFEQSCTALCHTTPGVHPRRASAKDALPDPPARPGYPMGCPFVPECAPPIRLRGDSCSVQTLPACIPQTRWLGWPACQRGPRNAATPRHVFRRLSTPCVRDFRPPPPPVENATRRPDVHAGGHPPHRPHDGVAAAQPLAASPEERVWMCHTPRARARAPVTRPSRLAGCSSPFPPPPTPSAPRSVAACASRRDTRPAHSSAAARTAASVWR